MSRNQLTLIQGGEFIVCEEIVYTSGAPAALTATASQPVNTMKSASVRLGDEIIPLPFIRSQERKVVSERIRVDGPIATRIAAWLDLEKVPAR